MYVYINSRTHTNQQRVSRERPSDRGPNKTNELRRKFCASHFITCIYLFVYYNTCTFAVLVLWNITSLSLSFFRVNSAILLLFLLGSFVVSHIFLSPCVCLSSHRRFLFCCCSLLLFSILLPFYLFVNFKFAYLFRGGCTKRKNLHVYFGLFVRLCVCLHVRRAAVPTQYTIRNCTMNTNSFCEYG